MAGNAFALFGCEESGLQTFDFYTLFYVFAVVWFFYAVVIFMSPTELAPGEGIAKYALLKLSAGFKDDFDGEWKVYGACAARFAGAAIGGTGAFFLWATQDWEDDSFTYAHAVIVQQALLIAAWVFCFLSHRDELRMVGFVGWLIGPVVALILAIVLLSDQDTNSKQLVDGLHDSGANPEFFLWFIAVLTLISAVSATLGGFFPAFDNVLTRFNIVDSGYEKSMLDTYMSRFAGLAVLQGALFNLWAAVQYDEDTKGDLNFTVPLIAWIICVYQLVNFLWHSCSPAWEDCFQPFLVATPVFILSSLGGAAISGWYSACHKTATP